MTMMTPSIVIGWVSLRPIVDISVLVSPSLVPRPMGTRLGVSMHKHNYGNLYGSFNTRCYN